MNRISMLLLILLSITLIGCGITEPDRETDVPMISSHNCYLLIGSIATIKISDISAVTNRDLSNNLKRVHVYGKSGDVLYNYYSWPHAADHIYSKIRGELLDYESGQK